MYLIARITLLIAYAATQTDLFFEVGLLILIAQALAVSVAIFQPYREDLASFNNVDIVLIDPHDGCREDVDLFSAQLWQSRQSMYISKFLLL